jgi:hypothetical protein
MDGIEGEKDQENLINSIVLVLNKVSRGEEDTLSIKEAQ